MPVTTRTIGEVLEVIRAEFPDISVSKVRYFESQGLIAPERDNPSGYRRFTPEVVERLQYVLRLQRDTYLPLGRIREHCEALDRGEEQPITESSTHHKAYVAEHPQEVERAPASQPAPKPAVLLTRRQLLNQSQLGEATLIELERAGIIKVRPDTKMYGKEALAIAMSAKRLGNYGMDTRQFRMIHQAALMEASLVEQILEPYRQSKGIPRDVQADVYKLVLHAHAGILHGNIAR